jgi:cytoplasmic FMR1 interacting protein
LSASAACCHYCHTALHCVAFQQKSIIKDSGLLTRERLCCGLSIFQHVLQHLAQLLSPHDELWAGSADSDTVLETNDNREFHRLWSALQFVVCLPPASLTVE